MSLSAIPLILTIGIYVQYHIDWGDGTSSDHAGGISSEVSPEFVGNGGWDGGANTSLSHSYAGVGLYIVTFTVEEPDWKWNLDNNIISDNDNESKYYAKAPQCVFAKIGGGFKNVGEDKDNFPLSANAGMIEICITTKSSCNTI